jgi:hypothetical protein
VWNPTSEEVQVILEFRPALRIEHFFEAFLGLAMAGKVSRKGLPSPLRLAVLSYEFRREVRPSGILRLLTPFERQAAFIGRRLGS